MEIIMRESESIKYQIMTEYLAGKLLRKEASKFLKVCERTITRWATKIKNKGLSGIKHGNYGKNTPNQYSDKFKEKVLTLVKEEYFDFNLVHLNEVLEAEHKIKISYTTLRRWCTERGLVKNPRRKKRKPRRDREEIRFLAVFST